MFVDKFDSGFVQSALMASLDSAASGNPFGLLLSFNFLANPSNY